MDDLEIHDPESRSCLERRRGKLHLLIGDSVAHYSGMRSRMNSDRLLNLSRGGGGCDLDLSCRSSRTSGDGWQTLRSADWGQRWCG